MDVAIVALALGFIAGLAVGCLLGFEFALRMAEEWIRDRFRGQ